MSRFVQTRFICASCGREKGASNHWFKLSALFAQQRGLDSRVYEVFGLDPERELGNDDYPACGEECLHKLESKIIAGEAIA